jgi:branched-subunit amino acid transport protein
LRKFASERYFLLTPQDRVERLSAAMGRWFSIWRAAALTAIILSLMFGADAAEAAQEKGLPNHEAAEAGRWSLLISASALVIGLPVLLFLGRWVAGAFRGAGQPSSAQPQSGLGFFRGLFVGQDKRVSTSKTVATVWTYAVASALLSLVVAKWLGHGGGLHNQTKVNELQAQYALLIGGPLGAAILAKGIVGSQAASGTASKPPGSPTASQLVSNDQGETDLGDLQYILFNTVALIFFFGEFLRTPVSGLPTLPDLLVGLTSVSAVGYVGKKTLPSAGPTITDVQPDHGKPADRVRIFGTGLIEKPAELAVFVGATEVSATDVQPLATTPNGPAIDVAVPPENQ